MKEKSELIIDAPSLSKLIPRDIKYAVFDFSLIPNDNLFLVQQVSWQSAVNLIQTNATSFYQLGQLICIYYAYQSTIELPDFIHCCQTKKVSHTSLGLLACTIGCNTSLEQVIKHGSFQQNQNLVSYKKFFSFEIASKLGYVSIIEQLFDVSEEERTSIIKSNQFSLFQKAVINGHLKLIKYLFDIAPELKIEMVECQNVNTRWSSIRLDYNFFVLAAASGHLETLKFLVTQFPIYKKNFLSAHVISADYSPFSFAAQNNHLAVMQYLWEIAADIDIQQEMLKKGNYQVFHSATGNGDIDLVNWLIDIASDTGTIIEMLEADNYKAFIYAAQENHLPTIKRLLALNPRETSKMIEAQDFAACAFANLTTLKFFADLVPDLLNQMIRANNYRVYRSAAIRSYVDVLEYLAVIMKDEVPAMIQSNDYGAFHNAAIHCNISIMAYLLKLAPEMQLDMVKAGDYAVFVGACRWGNLSVINFLIDNFPEEVENMLSAQSYDAFQSAAGKGHLEVIQLLLEIAPAHQKQIMIKSAGCIWKTRQYLSIGSAAKNGHLLVFDYLLEAASDDPVNIIKASDNYVWVEAVQNGHLHILHRLKEIAGDETYDIIASNDFEIVKPITSFCFKGDIEVVDFLLSMPRVFAYAELHQSEYSEHVKPFVANKLAQLHSTVQMFEAENPRGVFDIEDEKLCQLGFFIVRHLIRTNDESSVAGIRFLLNIPGIRNIAHLAITPEFPNELLRLAYRLENEASIGLLLNIPQVFNLAEANNFYEEELETGHIDLRAIATDRESSMYALTPGEKQRLQKLKKHYHKMIESLGYSNLFAALKDELIDCYNENPASINLDGKPIILPFDWAKFQGMALSDENHLNALKAYYQHPIHSAYRYLSKPNHWMHPCASYVEINRSTNEKWSTFEEYIPLIVLLWVAATDDSQIPTEDHTFSGRISHFFNELALLGRAHNWDQTRDRILVDGTTITEEYDDLEGDRPSCFSGVKRRLFQSLIGHPLFRVFSESLLKQELHEWVRNHFTDAIHSEHCEKLQEAVDVVVDGEPLSKEQSDFLKSFDIPKSSQNAFQNYMVEKYGHRTIRPWQLKYWFENQFKLHGSQTNHFMKFYLSVGLDSLLLNLKKIIEPEEGSSTSVNHFSMFEAAPPIDKESDDEILSDDNSIIK